MTNGKQLKEDDERYDEHIAESLEIYLQENNVECLSVKCSSNRFGFGHQSKDSYYCLMKIDLPEGYVMCEISNKLSFENLLNFPVWKVFIKNDNLPFKNKQYNFLEFISVYKAYH